MPFNAMVRRAGKGWNLVILVLLLLVAVSAAGIAYLAFNGATATSITNLEDASEIQACRALARLPADDARDEVAALELQGFQLAAEGLNRDANIRATYSDAIDAAQLQLANARAEYARLLAQSKNDRPAFLAWCNAYESLPEEQ